MQVTPAQEMVDSLAALLQLDVEVVDRRLNRICASPRFRPLVGSPQERGYVSRHVLNTGQPVLISDPGRDHLCSPCDLKETCTYRAGVACPIMHQGHVVGVVNLMGLSDFQRDLFHQGGDQLVKLISHLSAGLVIPGLLAPGGQASRSTLPAAGLSRAGQSCLHRNASLPLPPSDPFAPILGQSEAIKAAIAKARRLARSGAVILLAGETGTGKELFAKGIHTGGRSAAGPLVAVNCAAIPETLLESELFGYEEGAFTGARRGGKAGKFELAAGGTLFLDEIGELPLSLQPKLLRVLEHKTVDRVGGSVSQPINIRVVAASNRDLLGQVKRGEFRADLYYRLSALSVELPALRERRQDIRLLADYFLSAVLREMDLPRLRFGAAALRALEAYDWPGNVRELRNAVEYAAAMADGPEIFQADLPDQIHGSGTRSLQAQLTAYERELLSVALLSSGGHVEGKREVAQSLGISLPTLYRRLRELELSS